jgi:hypothetical protein
MYDFEMEQAEISDYTAEYFESREDYGDVMAEMYDILPEATPEEIEDADRADWISDCENPVEQGMYDDDPSPYAGDYSEM